MKVLTFSRQFPAGHPKAGQPTEFVEKILLGLLHSEEITTGRCIELARSVFDKDHPLCSYNAIRGYVCSPLKFHTIRSGSRWKAGEMASLRVWSDKPYRSKQIEFAQVEIVKVWEIEITIVNGAIGIKINGVSVKGLAGPGIAKNDGLEWIDFVNWFNIHPKKKHQVFTGQIISWSDKVNYDTLTEK
jgi:hypothetical protein